MAQFQSKYVPDAKVTKPKVYGPDKSSAGIEASLDIEYIMAMGEDVPTQFWSTNGQQPHNPSNEPFLVWLQNLANLTDSEMPLSMSVSYGDNEPGVDFDYASGDADPRTGTDITSFSFGCFCSLNDENF